MKNKQKLDSPREFQPTLTGMQKEILRLEEEKQQLEKELRSREDMMASLFAYLEAGK